MKKQANILPLPATEETILIPLLSEEDRKVLDMIIQMAADVLFELVKEENI